MSVYPFTDVSETHISSVFFAGERAYKLLKPVKLDFLDFSTSELRLNAVKRELQLNRRIAPDVYLGLADVIEGNRTVDRFVVMKRLPDDRRLSHLLLGASAKEHLRSVARVVAQFHSSLPPVAHAPMASSDAVRRNWDDNVSTMAPFVGSVLDPEVFGRVCVLYQQFLDGRRTLFDRRIEVGLVRDAHGDLTAQDIFCMDEGPQVLDCLAFADDLRICDVLNDVAFLAMDIERLGSVEKADAFMQFYLEFSNEHHPDSLLHHFVAYRAHVRAKVACLRHGQGEPTSAKKAQRYLDLALSHLERAAVNLVLIGGAPGTGKTTISEELGAHENWVVLNSDQLRKDLAGRSHNEHVVDPFGEGMYSEEATNRTYGRLLEHARFLLQSGESVVLDASWPNEQLRQLARDAAVESHAVLHEVECHLAADECKRRIVRRSEDPDRTDASDATPEIVDAALAGREPWRTARPLDTGQALATVLLDLESLVMGATTPADSE